MMPQTYNLLEKPIAQTHQDPKDCAAATAMWSKKNLQAIGLIQGTMSPTIWVDYVEYASANAIWKDLVIRFRKVGGADLDYHSKD